MTGVRSFAVAAALVCLGASPASAFKKCKTADGKVMFVDVPPAGCVVEGEFENPSSESAPSDAASGAEGTAEASDGGGDAQAIAARRRIERDLNAAAEDLERLRDERANAPRRPPGIYVNTQDGSGTYRGEEFVDPAVEAQIAAREEGVRKRISELNEAFGNLTREIASRHGGEAPSWWSATPRCPRCP